MNTAELAIQIHDLIQKFRDREAVDLLDDYMGAVAMAAEQFGRQAEMQRNASTNIGDNS